MINLLKYSTGIEFTVNNLIEIGDKMWRIERRINSELGITSKDDEGKTSLVF